jgi:NADH-quinone oxidoreductase subunit C
MPDETRPPAPEAQDKPAEPAKPAAPEAASPAAPPAGATSPKPAAPAAPPKPAAPAAPKPGPQPLDNDLVKRYKAKCGDAVREAWVDRQQSILVVEAAKLREVAQYSRDEEHFNLLSDLTAVHWPKREKPFDVVLNLYSFKKNERLRLKAHLAEGEPAPSVCSIWPAANWLEREVFDMFGIRFDGHPDLKRILLPDEWQGFPLRKDYDILTQDTEWIKENLGIESGQ